MGSEMCIRDSHSNLSNFAEFVTAIQPGGKLSNMDTQMIERCYHQIYKGKYSKRSVESYVGILRRAKKETEDRKFAKFCYTKLLFSLLTACDYYATNEYMTGTEIKDFGSIRELTNLRESFEKTKRMQAIRAFQPQNVTDDGKDINYLRTMLFYEAEQNPMKISFISKHQQAVEKVIPDLIAVFILQSVVWAKLFMSILLII